MHSSDLEKFYTKINGHINLVGAYMEDESLVRIIKTCRLKPYSVFTNDLNPKTSLETYWVDEFGNSLRFKDKLPYILHHDTQLTLDTKTSTDLFFANSIETTIGNSKLAFIMHGKYFEQVVMLIALYCQDEYIRAFMYDGRWNRISPLLLGLNTIREIFKRVGSRNAIDVDKRLIDDAFHFEVEKCVLTPIKEDMLSFLNEMNKGI